jgi:hypothetical protein
MLLRGCGQALALWALASALYYALLLRFVSGDDLLAAPILALLGLWFASAAYSVVKPSPGERALRRSLAGRAPVDGETVAACGAIVPIDSPLSAPLTGRECVAYEYDVFTWQWSGEDRRKQSDYTGMARTPSLVRTAQGDLLLHGFGSLDALPQETLPWEQVSGRVVDWVAATTFTTFERGMPIAQAFDRVQGMATATTARIDSRRDDATLGPDRTYHERIVPAYTPVCAIGTFSSAQGGLVSSLTDLVELHLGSPHEVLRHLAGKRRAAFWLALVVFLASHGGYAVWLASEVRGLP